MKIWPQGAQTGARSAGETQDVNELPFSLVYALEGNSSATWEGE